MSYATLACAWALTWAFGVAVLLAFDWPRARQGENADRSGRAALVLGYGFFIGALALTLWMRLLSVAGVPFGRVSIGAPLLLGAAVSLGWAARRGVRIYAAAHAAAGRLLRPALPGWQVLAWKLLLAWLALRFALLGAEVAWQPLYPWDAWVQWATKARVWYGLGRIVPFVPANAWLAGAPGAYFDASPGSPATAPLLQVWSCIALGGWDDSAMNWPWLLTLLALTLAVYGALRDDGATPLCALTGAYLVASLPLVDVQVALAGYADLLLAAVYALAALALYRWTRHRDWSDACVAAALAVCCPLIKIVGSVWALTLLPGVVVALLPGRRGVKLVALGLGAIGLAVLALARSGTPTIFGYRLDFVFEPSWRALIRSDFLFANWHLLWYAAIALALLGARRLVKPPLAPLTMIATAGVAFLFLVFTYPALGLLMSEYVTVNRAALPLAPVLVCLGVLLWRELSGARVPVLASAPAAVVADA